jgi:hypothetical protein
VELAGSARQQWGRAAQEVTIELVTGRTHQIRAQLGALGCPLLGDSLYGALAAQQGRGRPEGQQEGQQQQQQQAAPEGSGGLASSTAGAGCDGATRQHKRARAAEAEEAPGPSSAGAAAGAAPQQHQGEQQQQPHRWAAPYQDDPSKPIALQAFRLEVHDAAGRMGACPAVFEAGAPWWRSAATAAEVQGGS